ncbi:MAG: hypothetical protein RLZZ08_1474 [Pseudomonadota bacterium]|jgi:transcriptional regulator with XRE-family HTH domain
MTDEVILDDSVSERESAGRRLRAAREASGMNLEQVAAETRISMRNLVAIEDGAFADLPGRTYAIGFSRSYARLLGLDPEAIVGDVRHELDQQAPEQPERPDSLEPGDPARVPSSRLAWAMAGVLVLALIGVFFAMRSMFSPAVELPSLVAQERAQQAAIAAARPAPVAPGAAAAAPGGPVVFTALEDGVWVKFYDANDQQLMQKLMTKGESYTVPADAVGPQLWTGRPDALAITIGGKAVPRLSEDDRTVRDVQIGAAALLARPAPAPAPVSAPATLPVPASVASSAAAPTT